MSAINHTMDTTDLVTVRSLYLDLLKRALANLLYPEQEAGKCLRGVSTLLRGRSGATSAFQTDSPGAADQPDRIEGRDWPRFAHTMIGIRRLENLQYCVEDALARGVPGDLIETGVWRGGATILMRAVLKAHGVTDRQVWVADSFAGLPRPDPARYPKDRRSRHHRWTQLAVPLEEVRANFARYDLLDDQVRFLKGWFRDTLPTAPIERLAVLRLDGDMYESTLDALVHLYPKLSPGGFCIVDDYGAVAACREAVQDYRRWNGVTDEIVPIDWTGVYWRREG